MTRKHSPLTAYLASEVRDEAARGVTWAKIAAEIGVSEKTLRRFADDERGNDKIHYKLINRYHIGPQNELRGPFMGQFNEMFPGYRPEDNDGDECIELGEAKGRDLIELVVDNQSRFRPTHIYRLTATRVQAGLRALVWFMRGKRSLAGPERCDEPASTLTTTYATFGGQSSVAWVLGMAVATVALIGTVFAVRWCDTLPSTEDTVEVDTRIEPREVSIIATDVLSPGVDANRIEAGIASKSTETEVAAPPASDSKAPGEQGEIPETSVVVKLAVDAKELPSDEVLESELHLDKNWREETVRDIWDKCVIGLGRKNEPILIYIQGVVLYRMEPRGDGSQKIVIGFLPGSMVYGEPPDIPLGDCARRWKGKVRIESRGLDGGAWGELFVAFNGG